MIYRIRHTSASAHTNYLVHLLKSVEPLLNQGRVFYITSRPCQLLFLRFQKNPLPFSLATSGSCFPENPVRPGVFRSGAHSTANRHLVNHFLSNQLKKFIKRFKRLALPKPPAARPVASREMRILQAAEKLSMAHERKILEPSVSTYANTLNRAYFDQLPITQGGATVSG